MQNIYKPKNHIKPLDHLRGKARVNFTLNMFGFIYKAQTQESAKKIKLSS